jgi:invasion protein IalB
MTRRRAKPMLGLMLGFAVTAGVQARAAEAPPPPVPAVPQQTSASFGDWVTRCARTAEPATKTICEVAQTLVIKGQQAPIAQIAMGRGEAGLALGLTVLLPVNIAFDKQPTLGVEGDDRVVKLVFKRCVPAGCIAEAKLELSSLTAMRGAQKAGRLTFTDAAERAIALPVSFRGLAQALDELNKHG